MRAVFPVLLTAAVLGVPAPRALAQGAVAPAACTQPEYELEAAPALSIDPRLVITADEGLLSADGLSNLAGSVRLRQGEREFSASELSYDAASKQVRVQAESVFRNADFIVRSREALFDLGADTGSFLQTDYSLLSRSARGSADKITVDANRELSVDGAQYTTCGTEGGWTLQAEHIHLDPEGGLGTTRQATLRFGPVPILWLPWFQFPIDDRRRTGLLFPTFGETDRTGLDLRVPWYVNLAPNYDLTLTPRLMSERGLQLGAYGRYLIERGEGTLLTEYLDEDQRTGEERGYLQADFHGLLNSRLGYEIQAGATSDRTYFEDLGSQSELTSVTHLERVARLTYQAPAAYQVSLMTQSYQTISSNISATDEPYARLPQIRVRARTKNSRYHTRAAFTGEYVNFVRSNSVEGQRLDLTPSLRAELDNTAWFAAAQADYRYTAYMLSGVLPGEDERPERDLPQFSAEGGLRFDRVTPGGNLQTLEPYLFYLYTPFRDQSQLPVFDTGQPDFDYTQLFARNRFSGEDRIADANHIAVAARSRLLDPNTGQVKFSLAVGQLSRLHATRVQVLGISTPDTGPTDFFADLSYHLSSRWSSHVATAWSPDQEQFNRAGVSLRYRDSSRRADVAYRYRRGLLEQADVAASLPLLSSWRAAVRTRYSLQDSATLDNLVGLEYETCCYALRGSYRRYVASTAGEYNSGVYLQIELKGLTRLGAGFDGLLPLNEDLSDSAQY